MYLSLFVLVVCASSAVCAYRSPTIRMFPWVWKWVIQLEGCRLSIGICFGYWCSGLFFIFIFLLKPYIIFTSSNKFNIICIFSFKPDKDSIPEVVPCVTPGQPFGVSVPLSPSPSLSLALFLLTQD